ncbi:MAG TPA: hypothetical protein VG672_10280 [Bryobacteraceae bacterium]|nr:hypothetical protein [Bryobacteraceae bacterium]
MALGRIVCFAVLLAAELCGRDAPLQPVTVCEVVQDLSNYTGKTIVVVGRFSFRKTGRWLSEEACEQKSSKPAAEPPLLLLAFEPKSAPKLSPVFEIDGASLKQKMKLIKLRTTLKEFRFGSSDYDRWALVYGRVEPRPAAGGSGGQPAAQLSYYGDGVILFLNDEE